MDIAHAGTEDYKGGDLSNVGSYIQIKNGFDQTGEWTSYASGCIETIGDNENSNFNVDAYVENIWSKAATWINNYNSAHGTNCAYVSTALENGQATYSELNQLYALYRDNTHWGEY